MAAAPSHAEQGGTGCVSGSVGPGRLAHLAWDFTGLSPQGSFSALATFDKGVPEELQVFLS